MGLFDLLLRLLASFVMSVIAAAVVHFCGLGVNVPIEPRPWSWKEMFLHFVFGGVITIVGLCTRTANIDYMQHYLGFAARARAMQSS